MNEVFVVLTNPVVGREDEYNDWYSNRHLADVVALDGFRSAQRFTLAYPDRAKNAPYSYLALYEAADGRAEIAAKALSRATKEGRLHISGAMRPDPGAWWYRPITEIVSHP